MPTLCKQNNEIPSNAVHPSPYVLVTSLELIGSPYVGQYIRSEHN